MKRTILYKCKYKYLMRECEKGCQKAVETVNIKTSIFNLRYLSHFCMEFHVTNMSRSAVRIRF